MISFSFTDIYFYYLKQLYVFRFIHKKKKNTYLCTQMVNNYITITGLYSV